MKKEDDIARSMFWAARANLRAARKQAGLGRRHSSRIDWLPVYLFAFVLIVLLFEGIGKANIILLLQTIWSAITQF